MIECASCGEKVDKDVAMRCDSCGKWVHYSCEQNGRCEQCNKVN